MHKQEAGGKKGWNGVKDWCVLFRHGHAICWKVVHPVVSSHKALLLKELMDPRQKAEWWRCGATSSCLWEPRAMLFLSGEKSLLQKAAKKTRGHSARMNLHEWSPSTDYFTNRRKLLWLKSLCNYFPSNYVYCLILSLQIMH